MGAVIIIQIAGGKNCCRLYAKPDRLIKDGLNKPAGDPDYHMVRHLWKRTKIGVARLASKHGKARVHRIDSPRKAVDLAHRQHRRACTVWPV